MPTRAQRRNRPRFRFSQRRVGCERAPHPTLAASASADAFAGARGQSAHDRNGPNERERDDIKGTAPGAAKDNRNSYSGEIEALVRFALAVVLQISAWPGAASGGCSFIWPPKSTTGGKEPA